MAVSNKVIKIVHEITKRPDHMRITNDHSLDDLGIDDLSFSELLWKLEDEFLVELDNNDLFEKGLKEITIGEIIQLLEEI